MKQDEKGKKKRKKGRKKKEKGEGREREWYTQNVMQHDSGLTDTKCTTRTKHI